MRHSRFSKWPLLALSRGCRYRVNLIMRRLASLLLIYSVRKTSKESKSESYFERDVKRLACGCGCSSSRGGERRSSVDPRNEFKPRVKQPDCYVDCERYNENSSYIIDPGGGV